MAGGGHKKQHGKRQPKRNARGQKVPAHQALGFGRHRHSFLRAADSLSRTRTAFPAAAVELAGELAVNFLRRNHVHHAA